MIPPEQSAAERGLNHSEVRAHVASEEPLADVAYCFDGTLEGLLTAIFQAYAHHEDPQDIVRPGTLQPRLGQTVRDIETNVELAMRVQRGIRNTCGKTSFEAVMHASLSDDRNVGTIVYRFVRYAMAQNRPHDCTGCPRRRSCAGPRSCTMTRARGGSSVLGDITHPAVEPLLRLDRAVMNERHRMQQFVRFEHMENGVWLARCNPNAAVIPLIMDLFCGRFNTQPFIIFDEVHGMAGVYEGRDWYLVRTDEITIPDRATDEKLMQAAWKRFYDTVSIESRYNPELRRQFMPKRLWKNIVEMHERIPGENLERPRG